MAVPATGREALRRRLRLLALALAACLAAILIVEGALLFASGLRRHLAVGDPQARLYIRRVDGLGWRAMPNRSIELPGGGRYTTDGRGWRRFDTDGRRPLLLAVGDSFTQAVGVPDGAVYYDVVAERLGWGAAALAVGGYGAFQELLMVRAEESRLPPPAALLVQLTDNDPINDSLELERRSWRNNNLLPRPYRSADGEPVMGDPRRWHEHAVLGRMLTRRWLSRRMGSVEEQIERRVPEALALFERESVATAASLADLRRLFAGTPAFAFAVGGDDSVIAAALRRDAEAAGFGWLSIADEMARRAAGRRFVQADGSHWNELGHALAGEALAETLSRRLLQSSGSAGALEKSSD